MYFIRVCPNSFFFFCRYSTDTDLAASRGLKGFNMKFLVIEKQNRLAVHAICDTLERAQNWIDRNAPEYVRKGYFMDKTLTADSFTIKVA